MSTATIEKPSEKPATTATPADPDLSSVFYGSDVDPVTETQTDARTPTPASETGHADTSTTTSTASTEQAKPGDQPKGTAEKGEDKNEKKEDSGHRAAAARLGNEVKELRSQLDAIVEENKILKAKLDGTYQKPKDPTPEEISAQAEFSGREKASRAVADDVYGAEEVKAKIYDKGSAYEQLVSKKPWVQLRVMKHPQPTVEAMRILDEEAFFEQYGHDPKQWVAKIEAELKPKLLKEFTQQTTATPTGQAPPTVTESRGAGGHERERSLSDLFYGAESKK